MSSPSTWTALSSLKHGKILKPFLPLEKPDLAKFSEHFCNVYPGDEFYIFEENAGKWGRGYVVSQANPSDFSSAVINLNKLPDQKVRVGIVPLTHVRLLQDFELIQNVTDRSIASLLNERTSVPSMLDTEISTDAAVNGYDALLRPGMLKKPELPAAESEGDLLLELKAATSFLTSHIYAMYSIGEFQLFSKLLSLYDELENLRLTLSKKLFTRQEDIQMRKHASSLLTRIPKYLSATDKLNKFEDQEKNKLALVDISGYHAVMARDPHNGELLKYANKRSPVVPSDILMNQILYALSTNYPLNDIVADLEPKAEGLLDRLPPSNIMVNFEAVSGSTKNTPKGYKGMTAYLYLRNKKKRMTESFAIQVGSNQDLLLETVSAALFRNIPPTEIDNNGKVYLVAVLAEEVDITYTTKDLKLIKKGIAAGVTDISRIFSRHKGSLASGESHQFVLKMYGSFITPNDNINASEATRNNGWGELVERIIQGSSVGVAINPRAESLVVSVKEIKNKTIADENLQTAANTPLVPIRTTAYDPLSLSNERIYLRLGQIKLDTAGSSLKNSYLSVHIRLSNPSHTIVKGSNQVRTSSWHCVSVVPDEVIGEVLSIAGFTTNDSTGQDDISFTIYSNGQSKAEGKFNLKKGDTITDSKGVDFDVTLSTKSGATFGSLILSTDYIGTRYNNDPAISTVINWRVQNLEAKKTELISCLTQIQKKSMQQLLRFFKELLASLLLIFEYYNRQGDQTIESLAFDCTIHLLDVVIGKNDQYLYTFEDFCNTHKGSYRVGAPLLLQASKVLFEAEADWTQVSRQFCRVTPFVFKLATTCNSAEHLPDLSSSIGVLNNSILTFVSLKDLRFIAEQIVVLENLHYYLDSISTIHSPEMIWTFASTLLQQLGTRGIGLKDEAEFLLGKNSKEIGDKNGGDNALLRTKTDAGNAILARKKKDEHRLIIAKLGLNRRIIHRSLFNSNQRDSIIFKTIEWSMEVLLSPYDYDAARLASGNLTKCFEVIWKLILENGEKSMYMARAATRLLPVLSKVFIKYNKYCKVQGLFKSKRTYTSLFQCEYPFVEHTMDSIVTRETFVELLIELATIIAFTTRFAKHCTSLESGYDAIMVTEQDQEYLVLPYYTVKLSDANIISLIQLSKIMYDANFFPSDKWLSMYAVFIEGSFSILELLKFNMVHQFIPPSEMSEKFNTLIWGNYLRTILKMTTSKPAATCQLSRIPRHGCSNIVGDMRERGANLMEEVWNALGWKAVEEDVFRFQLKRFTGYQSEFLSSDYSILRDLILFSMQRHARCQVVGVTIIWTIMASECILNDDGLNELAKEATTGFYDLFHSNGYKPLLQEIESFIKLMKLTVKIDPEDVAYKQISTFINNLTDFLYILNDLRNVPLSDEFDDDRTFHKLNILGFLLNVDQPELLYQFIDDMYQSNIAKGNYVQAALSLDLLASTYDWSLHTLLPPSTRPSFPQQTPFKRKEALYRMIGHNYTKGNSLEQAVEIYTELREMYDKVALDLKGLAYVNDKLAKLYRDLENVDRIMPAYFKVSYIGSGFPESLKGKHFIHQGLPFEQLSSMQDRLSRLHPGSRILSKEADLAKYQDIVPMGKYIYVNSVEAGKGFEAQNSLASTSARLYVRNKDLRNFTSIKRLPNATGIHDLWCSETLYETYESFPALMNRSEIKQTVINKLPPIENAYRLIITKNHELVNIESLIESAIKDQEDASQYFGDLSRQVSGTVDSPVNGGIGQYRIFFTDKYNTSEYQEHVSKLKAAFNDLAIILNRCLEWHGRLLSSLKLKESHLELLKLYKANFKPEIDDLGLIIHDTVDEEVGSMINGYSNSYYSSDNESSTNLSTTKTNTSYSSSGSFELFPHTGLKQSSAISTHSGGTNFPLSTTVSSNASAHSGSENSSTSRAGSQNRLMSWRQKKRTTTT